MRGSNTARRSNQSILREINPEHSLQRLMPKFQYFGPPDSKNWLIGKDPDAGKDWRWKEKGMKEDEMVGWHHRLDGHEFEQALGVGDGQESLVCRSPWGQKGSDTTEWLNWIIWYTSTHLTAIFFQKGFEAVFSLITKEKFKTWAKKKKTQDKDKVKPRMGLNNSGPKKLSACFVVQSLSHVRLFATPRIAGGQSSLFFTVSQNLLKFIFLSQWCYLTISSSTTLFSFYLQSSPESGSFPVSQPFTSGGQCIGASASASVHPMNVQGWFPLGLTSLISLQLKGFSESSPASK